jgi:hypothetical protein
VKKKTLAQKYMHVATKKPLLFYGFLLAGVALFLWLTLSMQISTSDGTHSLLYVIFVQAGKSV